MCSCSSRSSLPLMALLALECLRDGPFLDRAGFCWRILSLVALFGLTTATTFYYAEFFALFVSVAVLLSLSRRAARQTYARTVRRHWPSLVAASILMAVIAVPIARVYLPVMRQSGGRDWHELSRMLLDPIDLIWMGRENLVWGWLFGRWHDLAIEKWAGKRLGIGLVGTLAWAGACVWGARMALRPAAAPVPASERDRAIAGVIIVSAALLQLTTIRFGNVAGWWLIFQGFPGMAGIRAVGRIQQVVALAMALGFAWLIQLAMSSAGARLACGSGGRGGGCGN